MRSTWASLAVVLSLFVGAWSCGDDDAPPKKAVHRDGGGDEYECVDEDGDGFGKYCDKGADCDDSDPNVTDICRRCAQPRLGCPCKAGTEPMQCDPPDMKVEGGTLVCSEGTRYCRDGFYSDCEIIGQYVLVPDK
jgi:hypothetical protein